MKMKFSNKAHSIFIKRNDTISKRFDKERHDLTQYEAMAMALDNLYDNGRLVPKINVQIRNNKGITFTANNP